jgi:hypothetical protein
MLVAREAKGRRTWESEPTDEGLASSAERVRGRARPGRAPAVNKVFQIALGVIAAFGGFVDISELVFNVQARALFGYQGWLCPHRGHGTRVETAATNTQPQPHLCIAASSGTVGSFMAARHARFDLEVEAGTPGGPRRGSPGHRRTEDVRCLQGSCATQGCWPRMSA